MNRIEINPDIAFAESLHSDFYTDDDYFEGAKTRLFRRTWQFAGLSVEVDNMLPVSLLDPLLSEPLLITNDGVNRCFPNVCTHRANILVDKKCKLEGIRCGYHGRRFDLKGKFQSMPEFEGVGNFPSAKDDLKNLPLGEWAGMLFVSLDPAHGFDEFFDPLLQVRGDFGDDAEVSTNEYFIDAHWALYCENYLEGFHIPFVHRGLNAKLDFATYKTDLYRFSSVQIALPPDGVTGNEPAARYYFVFPNLMFNFYPWGLSVNIVEPISKERTRVRYITMVTDKSKQNEGAGADLDTVEIEDRRIVESVQAGIRSQFYERGRYSVRREAGVHHFHRLIAEFMNNGEEL